MPKNKHFNVLNKIFKDECSTVVEIDHSEIDRIDRKKQGCATCCSLAAGLRVNGERMLVFDFWWIILPNIIYEHEQQNRSDIV